MIQGTTIPLNILILETDLSSGWNVYVTITDANGTELEKSGDSLTVLPDDRGCVIQVNFTQEETLAFAVGVAHAQVNAVNADGLRLATDPDKMSFRVKKNAKGEVISYE